jgi:YegS/Rv2252/BmrU family lipid kinase
MLERELYTATSVWIEHGWQVDLYATIGPGDAVRKALHAARDCYDLVIAAGGDGTINEVINGIAGTHTALATLPLGTMNVWARELGLPLQLRAAAEAMLNWRVQTVDLGRANGRYFLLMAGVGLDAEITLGVQPAVKRRFGALAYVLSMLQVAMRVRGTRARLLIDGKRVKGPILMVVIGNSQLYAGLFKITHRASINDGLLDVCVIQGDNVLSALRHLISILRRSYSHDPEISYYRAHSISIRSRPTLPVQVDGEAFGQTPMTFEIAPDALRALLPQRLPDNLVMGNG